MDIQKFAFKILSISKPEIQLRWRSTLLFAHSARSGSTAITNSFAEMGVAKSIDEIFNPQVFVHRLHKKFGGDSLQEYLNNVHRGAMMTNTMAFKSTLYHLNPVLDAISFEQIFPGLRIVYIERHDKLAQAISMYRAMISNRWHVITKNIDDIQNNLVFDKEKIIKLKANFEKEAVDWDRQFVNWGIDPFRISYEEFAENPDQVMRNIYEWFFGEKYTGVVKVNYVKLSGSQSLDWYNKLKGGN
jgi:LPS sulfotransferase NodH